MRASRSTLPRGTPRTRRNRLPCRLPHALAALVLVLASAGSAPPARASSNFATILVDGGFGDWAFMLPLYIDEAADNGSAPLDLGRIYVANDDRFVYLRFQLGALVNLQSLPAPLFIYLDTDDSPATGYRVRGIGSDLVIECAVAGQGISFFEQTYTTFYAARLNPAAFDAYQAPTVAATEFELRLKRDAPLPLRGSAAFPGAGFRLAFEVRSAIGQPVEVAPEGPGGLSYTFAEGTPSPLPDNPLARLDARHVRLLSYNVRFDGLGGPDSARFTRILRAIRPDVIAFQELYETPPALVAARLDRDLPPPAGARWNAFKGARGQVTASRFPATPDAGAPSSELATLVNLPDSTHATDLYVINSHFKCCGSIGSWEDGERQIAADALVAWLRDLRTPGGVELRPMTPIVHLGDLNLVGGPQPLRTLLEGDIVDQTRFGPDHPPDWDGSALARDEAIHSDGFATYTWRSDGGAFLPGKLDYVLFTDAVAGGGNRFVLNTLDMAPAKLSLLGLRGDDTWAASDHLPLIVDLDPGRPDEEAPPPAGAPLTIKGWPNPIRSEATLRVELARKGALEVAIHDVAGNRVRVLARDPQAAGTVTITWKGDDGAGRAVPTGVYYAVARHGGATTARRLALIR